MKIVFMGTPEFAAYSLKQILKTHHEVAAVVTVPDKPAGRGLKIHESEVKKVATQHQIPCLQPTKLYDNEFIEQLKSLKADIFVVVAFKKLPESIWSIPPKKTINLHASLLPDYRGAAPINWVIINGETHTGVTVFYINNEIDSGQIISFSEVAIPPNCNAGLLHDILMVKGAKLLVETLNNIEKNNIDPIDQNSFVTDKSKLKTAPKITHEICELNFNYKANELIRWINGLSPYPAAYIRLKNSKSGQIIKVKILRAEYIDGKHESPIKQIITDNKNYWYITADGGLLQIEECQAEGKKIMKIKDFLNGFRNLQQWTIA